MEKRTNLVKHAANMLRVEMLLAAREAHRSSAWFWRGFFEGKGGKVSENLVNTGKRQTLACLNNAHVHVWRSLGSVRPVDKRVYMFSSCP